MKNITKITTVIFLIFIACTGCKKDQTDHNSIPVADEEFTDPRDGQVYPFKKIGTQVWMTKNLNYAAGGSWCYDNNPANCDIYGRLYDWNTALTVAPPGWHLPSDAEWIILLDYLGGQFFVGGKMKTTSGWNSPNTGATNSSGFAGLPGGVRSSDGSFYRIGNTGDWWSSTADSTWGISWIRLSNSSDGVLRAIGFFNDHGFSVRCVRD
jgi:uncharacterized protein (TIGR02145 family)